MKILNFGSLNIDYVYSVDHMVRPGETLSSLSRKVFAGGKGLNQSVALARAGAEVYHAGAVGNEDGRFLVDILKENEIDTSLIEFDSEESSGHAIINVDKEGQNSIVLYGGANQNIKASHIENVLARFGKGDFLLLQNEINSIKLIMETAYEKGMEIILNPSPIDANLSTYDFSKVRHLILNEIEGEDIAGKKVHSEILDVLLTRFPDMRIVLTLGKQGSIYKDRDTEIRQVPFLFETVDTTGAGDTFTGYFFGMLSQGKDVETALRFASMASAIAVTRNGAVPSIPYKEEVQERLKSLE